MISGIGVANIGHSHPRVISAITDQISKYMHVMVYGEYIQSPQNEYAEAILQLLPAHLNSVYFTNSGTEATEGIMKLIKRVSGRSKIIGFQNAYHGSTQGALSVSGNYQLQDAFMPLLPDTYIIQPEDFNELSRIDYNTAGVFVEPLAAESGCRILSKDFLLALRARCTEVGAYLIFDECQTAFGRTGSMFYFDQLQITPDILMLGKAIGGGLPLGAFITDKKLMDQLSHDPVLGHITTFGGNPVSCTAGKAALSVLLEDQLISKVAEKENYIREQLSPLHNVLGIYGKGLLLAVELGSFEKVQSLIRKCYTRHILLDWFLFNNTSFRLAPPLSISMDELSTSIEIIKQEIDQL